MSLVYPKKCLLCNAFLPLVGTGKAMLCPACAAEVRRRFRVSEGIRLEGLDGVASPLYYEGKMAEAMKRFKFQGQKLYAPWFAAQMAFALSAQLDTWQPDCLTYIPLSHWREHRRGFHQSRLLADCVAEEMQIPCRAMLKKRLFVPHQSSQETRAARKKNAEHAFLPIGDAENMPKRVVLVDDIITSGATLQAAAEILRHMGAERVFALSAMRTRHRK